MTRKPLPVAGDALGPARRPAGRSRRRACRRTLPGLRQLGGEGAQLDECRVDDDDRVGESATVPPAGRGRGSRSGS